MHALIAGLLTKQSKIVYHDKSYSFETDLGWLIRFNGKKETFETKYPFPLILKDERKRPQRDETSPKKACKMVL